MDYATSKDEEEGVYSDEDNVQVAMPLMLGGLFPRLIRVVPESEADPSTKMLLKTRRTFAIALNTFGVLVFLFISTLFLWGWIWQARGVFLERFLPYSFIPVAWLGGLAVAVPYKTYTDYNLWFVLMFGAFVGVLGILMSASAIYEHEDEFRTIQQIFNGDSPLSKYYHRGKPNLHQENDVFRYWPSMYEAGVEWETNDNVLRRVAQGIHFQDNNNKNSGYGADVETWWDASLWTNSVALIFQVILVFLILLFILRHSNAFDRSNSSLKECMYPYKDTSAPIRMVKYASLLASLLCLALAINGYWNYMDGFPLDNHFDYRMVAPAFAAGLLIRPDLPWNHDDDYGSMSISARFNFGMVVALVATFIVLPLTIWDINRFVTKNNAHFLNLENYKDMYHNGTKFMLVNKASIAESHYYDDVFADEDALAGNLGDCIHDTIVSSCNAYSTGSESNHLYLRVTSNRIRHDYCNFTYAYDGTGNQAMFEQTHKALYVDHWLTLALLVTFIFISAGALWHSCRIRIEASARRKTKNRANVYDFARQERVGTKTKTQLNIAKRHSTIRPPSSITHRRIVASLAV